MVSEEDTTGPGNRQAVTTGLRPLCGRAWGKLSWSAEGKLTCLSLVSHCLDVASVVVTLLELPTWRHRFERLAGRPLEAIDIARLGVLAFLHDVGKASVGFWLKQLDIPRPNGRRCATARAEAVRSLGGRLDECGHTREVLSLISYLRKQKARVLPIQDIERWCGPEKLLWWAAISHHGDPILPAGTGTDCHWTWSPAQHLGYDPMSELATLDRYARATFPEAFGEGPPLPSNAQFVHGFAGLVSLADWIASNPQSNFFPYDLAPEESRWEAARHRAAKVLEAMQIDPSGAREDLRKRGVRFGDAFFDEVSGKPFQPTPMQRAMERMDLGPLIIAEDETGSGKTEAALWRFKTLFEAGIVDALAFLLPTRVSAVAIYERVQRFITRIFPDPKLRPNVVLAVPGYLKADGDTGTRDNASTLARPEVLWPDSPDAEAAYRRWAAEHPKRYLAAAVAVGTIDQALLSALQTTHSHLRAVSLLRTFIVVDEVHSSDTYMTRILETLLDRHVRAGGHAMLLSATLGVESRQRFLHPPAPGDVFEPPTFEKSIKSPYPLLSDHRGSTDLSNRSPGNRPIRSKNVTLHTRPMIRDAKAVAEAAAEQVERGSKVLVVRNTVDGAIATHSALVEILGERHPALFRLNGVPCPHHGRFAADDRKRLDEEVNRQFGKGSPVEARVLVGTQTLEQSLDICADYLITDLCPVDVLLQRLGRLHRHGRRRARGFETPRALVLCPEDHDLSRMFSRSRISRHGLGSVYPNLLCIDATWEVLRLRNEWIIPRDNRWLVEYCTNSRKLRERAEERGGAWLEHWKQLTGKETATRGEASIVRLDWNRSFEPFPEDTRIPTRLGEGRLLLKLPPGAYSPFPGSDGEPVPLTELQIPHFLAPPDTDFSTENVSLQQIAILNATGFEFRAANYRYRYDNLGLRRIDAEPLD